MVIVDIKKPKKCIWYEDGQDCKCPLLDDNDCCRGQGNEANSAANDWDDLMKGCPIKGVLPDEHGELIDRDDVKKEILKRIPQWCSTASPEDFQFCSRREMLYPISHAEVIVAAERKDDGK